MTIKVNHRHVDLSGVVYLPYLHEWNSRSSNLIGLVEIMSNIFSFDPPLFTKPVGAPSSSSSSSQRASFTAYPGTTTSSSSTAYPSSSQPIYQMTSTPNPVAASAYPSSSSTSSSNQYSSTSNTSSSSAGVIVLSAQEKHENLVLEVTSKIQQEIYSHQQSLKKEIDNEFHNTKYLDKSLKQLTRSKEETQSLIFSLQEGISAMNEKSALLDNWDREQSAIEKPQLEDLLFSYDDLSNQILKLNGDFLSFYLCHPLILSLLSFFSLFSLSILFPL
jgi:hypothetical protein